MNAAPFFFFFFFFLFFFVRFDPAAMPTDHHGRRWATGADDTSGGGRVRAVAAAARRTAHDPAAQVSPAVVLGIHTDLGALRRAAVGSHALTFDHEHVPTEHLVGWWPREHVLPSPEALRYAQDKAMRGELSARAAPVPRFTAVDAADDALGFAAEHGWRSSSRRSAAVTTGAACGCPLTRRRPKHRR